MLSRSVILRFKSSDVMHAIGDVKKFKQNRVTRQRVLALQQAKERRRELVEQGVIVDHLVAQAYQELKEEGYVLPEERKIRK